MKCRKEYLIVGLAMCMTVMASAGIVDDTTVVGYSSQINGPTLTAFADFSVDGSGLTWMAHTDVMDNAGWMPLGSLGDWGGPGLPNDL